MNVLEHSFLPKTTRGALTIKYCPANCNLFSFCSHSSVVCDTCASGAPTTFHFVNCVLCRVPRNLIFISES